MVNQVGNFGDSGNEQLLQRLQSVTLPNYTAPVQKDNLMDIWNDAYAAFKGAFDTPQMRRAINDEYAEDARKRLRDFDEPIRALLSQASPSQQEPVAWDLQSESQAESERSWNNEYGRGGNNKTYRMFCRNKQDMEALAASGYMVVQEYYAVQSAPSAKEGGDK